MRRMMMGCLNAGRAVSLTNLVTNGSFTSKTGWTDYNGTSSVSGNEISMTALASPGITRQETMSITNTHKYYHCEWLLGGSSSILTYLSDGSAYDVISHSGSGSYEFLSGILTATASTSAGLFTCLQDNRSSGFTQMKAKYASCIDLTSAFGSGNEPTKAEMDALMTQFANNWLDGTQTAIYNW